MSIRNFWWGQATRDKFWVNSRSLAIKAMLWMASLYVSMIAGWQQFPGFTSELANVQWGPTIVSGMTSIVVFLAFIVMVIGSGKEKTINTRVAES